MIRSSFRFTPLSRQSTIFVFYTISTLVATFLGHNSPICSQALNLKLPCDDKIWEAQTESQWHSAIESSNHTRTTNVDFQAAAHALLIKDRISDCGHESAGSFSQYVLLCAISETITLARRSPLNYSSLTGYQSGNMDDFLLRTDMVEVLKICRSLWWASPECLWETSACAHPFSENNLLLQYMLISLSNFESSRDELYGEFLIGLDAAAEVFCSCSKVGFCEVCTTIYRYLVGYGFLHSQISRTCRKTISRPGRHCAVASARFLKRWASGVDPSSYQDKKNQHERLIFGQVCQALKRGAKEGFSMNLSCPETFEAIITDVWCTILGDRNWI